MQKGDSESSTQAIGMPTSQNQIFTQESEQIQGSHIVCISFCQRT